MERESFTKNCAAPAQTAELFDGVDFPVAPDFDSVLPRASLLEVYRACESMLPTYLELPGEWERRKQNGVVREFTL